MLTFQITSNLSAGTEVEVQVLDARTGSPARCDDGDSRGADRRGGRTWLSRWTLDRLANDAFPGRVVRKDLVRRVKVGANVPVYVLEFLLGKYCATDDPAAIETGLDVVNQTLTENFIRPDESEKAKARSSERASTA